MSENSTVPENDKPETEAEQQKTVAEVQAHLAEAILGLQKLGGDAGTTGLVATSGGSCGAVSCG